MLYYKQTMRMLWSLHATAAVACVSAWAYLPVVDIAPHARVSASAWHGAPWAPERAIDGDLATYWRQPRGVFPVWWQAEFVEPQRLVGVALRWKASAPVVVYAELDEGWMTAAEETLPDGDRSVIYFSRPLLTRRLRLEFSASPGASYVGLAEVECFADAAHWERSRRDWPAPTLSLARTRQPPRIDGRLDDACWGEAAVASPFLRFNSHDPALGQTTAYLLADEHHLYVGFDCRFATAEIIASATAHDQVLDAQEAVGVLLDTNLDGVSYLDLAVNAAGAQYDAVGSDRAWDPQWFAAVQPTDGGWQCEWAVPFDALNLRLGTADNWGINLWRNHPAGQEASSWAPVTGTPRRPDRFGRLRGVQVPASHWRGLDNLRVVAANDDIVVIWGDPLERPPRDLSVQTAAQLRPNTDAIRLAMAEGEGEPLRLLVAARHEHATGVVRLREAAFRKAVPPLQPLDAEASPSFVIEVYRIGFVNDRLADVLTPAQGDLLVPGRTTNWWLRSTAGPYGGHTFIGALEIDYIGADGESKLSVPLERTIWPLQLPERPGFATAGFSLVLEPELIGAASDEETARGVAERVAAAFRAARISLDGCVLAPAPGPEWPREATARAEAFAVLARPWLQAGLRINAPPLPPSPWAPSDDNTACLTFWNDFARDFDCRDKIHLPYPPDVPPARFNGIVKEASRLAQYAPHLRRLLVQSEYAPELLFLREFVDDWAFRAPHQRDELEAALAFCAERRAAGDNVWWHIRDALALDSPLMSARAFFWACACYQIDGCYHGVQADYRELAVRADAAARHFSIRDTGPASAGVLWWCDARTRAMYPSLRWEQLRDGLEDWELLRLLARAEAQATSAGLFPSADELLAAVVSGPARYALEPRRLHQAREAVARVLLQRRSDDVAR